MAQQFTFTAEAGVRFSGDDGAWATFERTPELDTPEGGKRYRFVTSDPEIARRLRGIDGYGITEARPPRQAAKAPAAVREIKPAGN